MEINLESKLQKVKKKINTKVKKNKFESKRNKYPYYSSDLLIIITW